MLNIFPSCPESVQNFHCHYKLVTLFMDELCIQFCEDRTMVASYLQIFTTR
ncbi:unnamed protein product [Larinioides sclopetarius]|uniref:Uncharacterized protein n=1 Tax=Larinioides sclopetarius TaxID=280406 RepID=A0AAV2BMM8_9ARAC